MLVLLEKSKKVIVTSVVLGSIFHMQPDVSDAKPNVSPKEKKTETKQKISFGSTGEEVLQLQTYLSAFQYYQASRDGFYGLLTKHAVEQFQEENGLKVDGIAGATTISYLLTKSDVQFSTNKPVTSVVYQDVNRIETALLLSSASIELNTAMLLQTGSRGSAVKELQTKLRSYGYNDNLDGIFGPNTRRAVITYQKTYQLQVDGIAGPETIGHLLSGSTQQSPSPEKKEVTPETKKEKINEVTNEATNETTSVSVVSTAKTLTGTPYQWGGTSPSGFDCSGFLQYVFRQHQVQIPRTVRDIWNSATSVSQKSVGDLVFFSTYRSGPSHAGIYLGNNRFIHAGSSTGVTVSDLSSSYWASRYLGAKRISR